METILWNAVEKTLPPIEDELAECEKEFLEKLENNFMSTLSVLQQDMFEKFKNNAEKIIKELIYKRSGLAFSVGLKCGIELQSSFDEIDG